MKSSILLTEATQPAGLAVVIFNAFPSMELLKINYCRNGAYGDGIRSYLNWNLMMAGIKNITMDLYQAYELYHSNRGRT